MNKTPLRVREGSDVRDIFSVSSRNLPSRKADGNNVGGDDGGHMSHVCILLGGNLIVKCFYQSLPMRLALPHYAGFAFGRRDRSLGLLSILHLFFMHNSVKFRARMRHRPRQSCVRTFPAPAEHRRHLRWHLGWLHPHRRQCNVRWLPFRFRFSG